ncbi:MAG: hypothetical protein VKO39_03045 [Cyanobacteriota bacterium]|nr:hypothetical protein [Cyanobacteriota bacterium]
MGPAARSTLVIEARHHLDLSLAQTVIRRAVTIGDLSKAAASLILRHLLAMLLPE